MATSKSKPASDYRPEIDGLRAVAVIPVVLFHLGFPWIQGGYLGVDVFFVISGFLITSLIIREHDRGTFSFSNFWLRRIRRIFPALAAMLIVTSLAGGYLFLGTDFDTLGTTGLAALLSFANVVLWKITGGYWGSMADTLPLLHTWSLSVEEQFYFLYPFLLAFLFRRARPRLFAVLLAVAAASFAAYVYGVSRNSASAFYLLPTRAWELGGGCLLAIAEWRRGGKFQPSTGLSLAGLAAIVVSYVFLSKANAFPGALAIVVAGALLVIGCATNPGGLGYRLLAAPPMVFIGKISYSLYLWHWPVMILVRNHNSVADRPIPEWVLLPAIIAASLASYYLVEKTTRHREKILRPALVGLAVGCTASVLLVSKGAVGDLSVFSPALWKGRQYDVTPVQEEWTGHFKRRMAGIHAPLRDKTEGDAYKTTGIVRNYGGRGVDIVVLGDSHALMWAGVLDEIARELGCGIAYFTADGVDPIPDPAATPRDGGGWRAVQLKEFEQARLARIREWKPPLVLLLARWSVREGGNPEAFIQQLHESGCRVMTIEQPPELFFGDKNAMREMLGLGLVPREGINQYLRPAGHAEGESYQQGRRRVAELAARHAFFSSVSVADLYLESGNKVWVLEGNRTLYIDDDHLSQHGAMKAKERIEAAVRQALKQSGREVAGGKRPQPQPTP